LAAFGYSAQAAKGTSIVVEARDVLFFGRDPTVPVAMERGARCPGGRFLFVALIIHTAPARLLAYHAAMAKGSRVGKPVTWRRASQWSEA
jgi:hypothetical protein